MKPKDKAAVFKAQDIINRDVVNSAAEEFSRRLREFIRLSGFPDVMDSVEVEVKATIHWAGEEG